MCVGRLARLSTRAVNLRTSPLASSHRLRVPSNSPLASFCALALRASSDLSLATFSLRATFSRMTFCKAMTSDWLILPCLRRKPNSSLASSMRADGPAGGWCCRTAAAAAGRVGAGAGGAAVGVAAGGAGLVPGAAGMPLLGPLISEELSPAAAATAATAGRREASPSPAGASSVELAETGTSCAWLLFVLSASDSDTAGASSELEGSPDILCVQR